MTNTDYSTSEVERFIAGLEDGSAIMGYRTPETIGADYPIGGGLPIMTAEGPVLGKEAREKRQRPIDPELMTLPENKLATAVSRFSLTN